MVGRLKWSRWTELVEVENGGLMLRKELGAKRRRERCIKRTLLFLKLIFELLF